MRRLVLASILVAMGGAAASSADDFPYGSTHSFTVYRNGQQIGTHTLAFQHSGDQRAVATSIDFSVKAMGMTVYRYAHRGNEVWKGSTLQSIDTKTDDNGKQFAMRAHQNGNGLAVERKDADSAFSTSANDQGLKRNDIVRETLPAEYCPRPWNLNQVKRSNTITRRRRSRLPISARNDQDSSRSIRATHYRYSGISPWISDSTIAALGESPFKLSMDRRSVHSGRPANRFAAARPSRRH